MDRMQFFNHINGITYPEILVDFFDHVVALQQLVKTNSCTVSISNTYENKSIEFIVQFKTPGLMQKVLQDISMNGNVLVIYGRTMTIHYEVLTDTDLKIKLY